MRETLCSSQLGFHTLPSDPVGELKSHIIFYFLPYSRESSLYLHTHTSNQPCICGELTSTFCDSVISKISQLNFYCLCHSSQLELQPQTSTMAYFLCLLWNQSAISTQQSYGFSPSTPYQIYPTSSHNKKSLLALWW